MRNIFVSLVMCLLVLCPPGVSSAQDECLDCVCDCPYGPPPPPYIDPFCASAYEGEICCLSYDGSQVGVCHNNECWPIDTPVCGPWQKEFDNYAYCYKPNCCDISQYDLNQKCERLTRLPLAVVCDPNPTPGEETDRRECINMEFKVECGWNEGMTLNVLCCEMDCDE